MKILINCTGKLPLPFTEIFKIQKQSPEAFLKVSENSQENSYVRVSCFKVAVLKLQASDLQLY